MMIKELKLTKIRKLLGAVAICLILIAGSTMLWQMGQVAEAAILDPHPGLVGWWRFDEGTGSIAKDSSGFGNDGIIYGATWVTGKYGNALSFDGTNDFVEVPNSASLQIDDNITIAAWVRKDSNINFMGVVEKPDSYFMIGRYSVPYGFYSRLVDLDSGNTYAYVSSSVTTGQWAFIVATWVKGDYLRIYYDGVQNGISPAILDKTLKINTNKVYIGYSAAGSAYFSGTIDEVRIYDRALSAAEIQESFQKGPDFSSKILAKVPKGATQVIATVSWQGIGDITITIESPSESYTEDTVPVYQKTVYSTSGGTSGMLNIKRLSVSVPVLSSDENWYVMLEFDDVQDYRLTVEVQK